MNAFGVFQTYYENNPYWTASPSDISWIGSIQAFLLLVVGGMSIRINFTVYLSVMVDDHY